MRLTERYILAYAVTTLISGVLLMTIGVNEIEIYYTVYLIEFLAALLLASTFRHSMERHLRPIVVVFLLGFVYVVVQRILYILT